MLQTITYGQIFEQGQATIFEVYTSNRIESLNKPNMKRLIHSLSIFLFVGLMIVGCGRKDDNMKQLILKPPICKNDFISGSRHIEHIDSLSCIEYSFDNVKNKLTLKHINAGFNCCPNNLFYIAELGSDTILIHEFEETAGCRCTCLYDLDIEINVVDVKKYQIKFIEPYVGEQSKLIFEIDLANEQNGIFCVTRVQSPWGMGSLNE